jgi:hypothetical protein
MIFEIQGETPMYVSVNKIESIYSKEEYLWITIVMDSKNTYNSIYETLEKKEIAFYQLIKLMKGE